MVDTGLDQADSTAKPGTGQDEPTTLRVRMRQGVIDEFEGEALRFGFPSLQDAVRALLPIFSRSERVRDAVREDIALGVLSPAEEG